MPVVWKWGGEVKLDAMVLNLWCWGSLNIVLMMYIGHQEADSPTYSETDIQPYNR